MAKKDFQIEMPDNGEVTPFIYRVSEEGTGTTWRDAKKALRKWYLDEANKLRSYTEAQFAKQEKEFLEANSQETGGVETSDVAANPSAA